MTEDISQFLTELDQALPYSQRVRAQVTREVRDHLLSLMAKAQDEGLNEREAGARALKAFGTIDQFIARFEAEGGPITADDSLTFGFGVAIGSYVGLILGATAWAFLEEPLMLITCLVAGALAGVVLPVKRNLGPLVGAAMGAIFGYGAVAHYLLFQSRSSFSRAISSDPRAIILWSTVIAALVGMGLGFVPRLRKDPSPLLWATALGLGGHVVARMWLEDAPTLTSMAMLLLGFAVGGALGLHALGRRYALVPLGAMMGFAVGVALFIISTLNSSLFYSLFPTVNPAVSLIIAPGLGLAVGAVLVSRSKSNLTPPDTPRPNNASMTS